MLSTIESVNSAVNNFIWGVPAMICIIGVGLYLSIRTGFLQIRKFPYAMKVTIGRMLRKRDASDGALTPFQAVCTALAATVGTGNIAGVAGLCGLRKGIFARGASSLLLRRLQGRREPTEKPGTHEENAGEKAGRLLRFAASKGLTFRAFLRVFPGWEYLITFLPGLPSYFVTSSTSGHVDPRHRKEGSLGDSTRICDFESCHL